MRLKASGGIVKKTAAKVATIAVRSARAVGVPIACHFCEVALLRFAQTQPHREIASRWLRPPLELRTASLGRPCSGSAAIRFAAGRKVARCLA